MKDFLLDALAIALLVMVGSALAYSFHSMPEDQRWMIILMTSPH
jgi:hypothetical protein